MTSLVVESPRLVLRPLQASDLGWFHALNVRPETRRYLFDDESWTMEEMRERLIVVNGGLWEREETGLFVVDRRDSGGHVGWCGFWYFHEPSLREVGYAVHPECWGQGYAGEAARAVMAYGAAVHGDTRFHASADAPNTSSHRVLAKLGFGEVRRGPGRLYETVYFVRELAGLDVSDIRIARG